MCQQMKMVDGGYFYKNYLLKTSFIGECNQQLAYRKHKIETKSLRKIPTLDLAESIVKFDEKGDGPARYTIFNYQKNDQNNKYDYRVSFLVIFLQMRRDTRTFLVWVITTWKLHQSYKTY